MSGPYCTIIAGPNGSGKSSVYEKLQPVGEFVNADVIAAALPGDLTAGERRIRAGRVVVSRLRELIASKQDFVFETTLSSRHSLDVMREAHAAGFEVGLVFVALNDPKENVKRVRWRVKLGGHDIPVDVIIRRYEASFGHLAQAIRLARETVVIDNTQKKPVWVLKVSGDTLILPPAIGALPATKRKKLHRRLIRIARTVSSTFLERLVKPKPKNDR